MWAPWHVSANQSSEHTKAKKNSTKGQKTKFFFLVLFSSKRTKEKQMKKEHFVFTSGRLFGVGGRASTDCITLLLLLL